MAEQGPSLSQVRITTTTSLWWCETFVQSFCAYSVAAAGQVIVGNFSFVLFAFSCWYYSPFIPSHPPPPKKTTFNLLTGILTTGRLSRKGRVRDKKVTKLHMSQRKTTVLHALHVVWCLNIHGRSRSTHGVKWPVLQTCWRLEHLMKNIQPSLSISKPLMSVWLQDSYCTFCKPNEPR